MRWGLLLVALAGCAPARTFFVPDSAAGCERACESTAKWCSKRANVWTRDHCEEVRVECLQQCPGAVETTPRGPDWIYAS